MNSHRPTTVPRPHVKTAAGIDIRYCKSDAAGAMRALMQYMPLALAVRELMRMRGLADYGTLEMPMLDVGCGDGLFWEVFAKELQGEGARHLEGLVGIDINRAELDLASVRLSPVGGEVRSVDISDQAAGAELRGRFKTIIANCSLEHVPKLEHAIQNIGSYLAPASEPPAARIMRPSGRSASRGVSRMARCSDRSTIKSASQQRASSKGSASCQVLKRCRLTQLR